MSWYWYIPVIWITGGLVTLVWGLTMLACVERDNPDDFQVTQEMKAAGIKEKDIVLMAYFISAFWFIMLPWMEFNSHDK